MRLVYYSITDADTGRCPAQWERSIRSLRAHGGDVRVHLVVYGPVPDRLRNEAWRQRVTLHEAGDYRALLDRMYARGALLAHYPTFHKFLSLDLLPTSEASQILYLDCDTFFFGDVGALFARYADQDWYAREEPYSRRSSDPSYPAHLDEPAYEALAAREGERIVAPFNSGVCLLNHGIWQELSRLHVTYLDYAFRLVCGRALAGAVPSDNEERIRAELAGLLTVLDQARALPYPSDNDWIVEQFALWLTLGRLPRFNQGFFDRAHVSQGSELAHWPGIRPVVAHYFSNGEERFFRETLPLHETPPENPSAT